MTTPMFDDLVDLERPEQPEQPVETSEAGDSTAEWPKTVDVAPEGAKSVQEFADHIKALLVERLVAEGTPIYEAVAQGSRVNTNSVYQYTRRDKNPLPSLLVKTTNEDGTPGDPKILIPTEEATQWWMNRPERGPGAAGSLPEEDVEKLLYKAGKKAAYVQRLLSRKATLDAVIEKQTKLRDRYGERLMENGKSWDEANAAYQSKEEEKADKESVDSEIPG